MGPDGWLGRVTKRGKDDEYVLFTGHGLVSDDGRCQPLTGAIALKLLPLQFAILSRCCVRPTAKAPTEIAFILKPKVVS